MNMPLENTSVYDKRLEDLLKIGASLSAEKDHTILLEQILSSAKKITNADGGTLYLVKGETLHFEIMMNSSLNIHHGGTSAQAINLQAIPMKDQHGIPNVSSVATFSAVSGLTINIADIYHIHEVFNFAGTRAYDQVNGYKSQSFLTVPMKNHEGLIIGVLQLINARNPQDGSTQAFSAQDELLCESLASQAAVALSNRQLIDNLQLLMEKFIEMIAGAIDEKSPYTGGHCRRVPEIATMMADAINRSNETVDGKHIRFTETELYEIKIAALLHDCGKITTPVHVVDKATKLETIFDRVELLKLRFELAKKDAQLRYLQHAEKTAQTQNQYQAFIEKLDGDLEFLLQINKGSEFMNDSLKARVEEIASYHWIDSNGQEQRLILTDELENLKISKGTLTDAERQVINNHIVMTQKMLGTLPFPRHLKNVPAIAGNHHERIDGKGYPNGLIASELSVQERLMCIADIFEALTASDRPYKQGMSLSTALKILGNMSLEKHIDQQLYNLFLRSGLFEQYAREFLKAEQLDDVDISTLPGYLP